jgi:hypothetical protein
MTAHQSRTPHKEPEGARMSIRWAHSGEVGSSGVFETVHSGLTIQLIETSRDDLMTCKTEDAASLVIAQNTAQYDFIPVTADLGTGRDQIVGLFHAAKFRDGPIPDGCIEDHLTKLSEEHLIGADTSILDFVTDADTRPCRLVVAGPLVSGLVSLSDLQKLPVRAALFALITGFEITMAEAIRGKFVEDEDWMVCLNDGRKDKIKEEIAKSKNDDGFVDALLFTQFCDKKEILIKSFQFGPGKTQLRRQLEQIQKLRDGVVHANEYAATPEQARDVCAIVRDLLDLRAEIAGTRRIP